MPNFILIFSKRQYYHPKVLEPGYTGYLSERELDYVRWKIWTDKKVAEAWALDAKGRIPREQIQKIAMFGRKP